MKTISLTLSLATLALVSSEAEPLKRPRLEATFGSPVAGVTADRLDRGYFHRGDFAAPGKVDDCMITVAKTVSVTVSPRALAAFPHLGKPAIVTTECNMLAVK